jgi:hypothetical protein
MNKIKINVSTGFSGVIATGSYQNARPSYNASMEYEIDDMLPEQVSEHIKKAQVQLQAVCYGNFKKDEEQQIIDRIARERADIRFYDGYPSVTSIINWDADMYIPPHELQQYASQSNLVHAQVEHDI